MGAANHASRGSIGTELYSGGQRGTFDANQKCPAIEEPSSNRNIIAGTGTGPISLAKCILPRFLRMFTRAENDKGAEKEAKWNNKFNHDKDAKPCSAYNNGVAHNAFQLKADGSCRFGHVCDHWVSDKGPGVP